MTFFDAVAFWKISRLFYLYMLNVTELLFAIVLSTYTRLRQVARARGKSFRSVVRLRIKIYYVVNAMINTNREI